jgi:adenosylcobinamide-GDP ribazoletransferase
MRSFFAALQFLTIVPLPAQWAGGAAKDLRRSVPFFPVVGLLVGGAMVALHALLAPRLPAAVTSVLIVIAMLAVSGGLHLDGLSDTADGFFSSRPRERILEIMKDSHCGPMGVAAVVCVLALKMAAVSAIPMRLGQTTLLLMPLAGRCALVMVMALLDYARTEGGTGAAFASGRPRWEAAMAIVALAGVGWLTCGWLGIATACGSILTTLLLAGYSWKKIGGWTGDTLGATCEIVEIVPAIIAGAWVHGAP